MPSRDHLVSTGRRKEIDFVLDSQHAYTRWHQTQLHSVAENRAIRDVHAALRSSPPASSAEHDAVGLGVGQGASRIGKGPALAHLRQGLAHEA